MSDSRVTDFIDFWTLTQRELFDVTAEMPCRLIYRAPGQPYLERYFIGQYDDGITAYLHRFVSADIDEETHDHPWRAVAKCLHGGYREEVVTAVDYLAGGIVTSSRWIKQGDVNRISGGGLVNGTFHRICEALPETWTYFTHYQRIGSWGFLLPESGDIRYVHWRKHLEGVHGDISSEDPDRNRWWLDAPLGADAGREDFGL